MNAGTECFVSGVIASVLRLSRIVGVAPLSFVKKSTGWQARLSRGWSIYGKLYFTVNGMVAMTVLITDLYAEMNKPYIEQNYRRRVVWLLEFVITFMIAGTAAFGAPDRMRSIIACLNQTQKINRVLNSYQQPTSKFEEKWKSYMIIFWVIVTLILGCIDYGLTTYTKVVDEIGVENWLNVMFIFAYFCIWTNRMQLMLFTIITLHVVNSFKAVNTSLRHIYNDIVPPAIRYDDKKRPSLAPFRIRLLSKNNQHLKNDAQAIASSENNADCPKLRPYQETIHSLTQAYVSTCDVVREVDRCHGLLLLMMLVSFLLQLVVTIFNLINAMYYQESQSMSVQLGNVVMQMTWCLYHTCSLMLIIEPSHITNVEMKMTRELVSRLMYCPFSVYEPLAVELELFSQHLMLNQVSYSPMKVTTLSRSLVVVIFGSITTYLAVLVDL